MFCDKKCYLLGRREHIMKKQVLLGLLALAGGVVLVGCAGGNNSESGGNLIAAGSTALQPLVEKAATDYQAQNPNVMISVQGGGSGLGLTQVQAKAISIGNSDLFAEEKGMKDDNLVDHKVAVVGVAPVVSKDAGITNVTKQQLIDVFSGKVKNWKEVGGKDQAITIVNRAEGSGTLFNFEKYGLDNTPVSKDAQQQDSSGTVRQIVAQTPGAISYLAFSYVDKTIQALSIDGVAPTEENVATNDWKIWSYEHMYTNKETQNKDTQEFIQYILSDKVQNGEVKELGYLPMSAMKVERDANGNVSSIK